MAVRRVALAVALGYNAAAQGGFSAPQQNNFAAAQGNGYSGSLATPLRLLRRPPQLLLLIRGVLSLVVTMTGVAAPTTNLRSKPVSFSE